MAGPSFSKLTARKPASVPKLAPSVTRPTSVPSSVVSNSALTRARMNGPGSGASASASASVGPTAQAREPLAEPRSKGEGISSYHPKVLRDVAFVRDCILRGLASQGLSRAVVELVHSYERWDNELSAGRPAHGYANLDALFEALARMAAIDTSWALSFTHYRAPLDILWFDLDEPYRADYQALYRLTAIGRERSPTEDPNYAAALAKQEAIGVLGMLKGIGLGLAGLVDDARYAGSAQGGTNLVSETFAATFDDAGSWWFGHDWSEGEAVTLGLTAAELGELGGSLVFTLATFEVKALEFAQKLLTLPAMARGIENSVTGLRKLVAEDEKAHRELYSDPRVWQELVNIAGMVLGMLLSKTQRGQKIGGKLAHFLLDSAPLAPIAGKMIEALLSDQPKEQKERAVAFAFSELLQLVANLGRGKIANRPLGKGGQGPAAPAEPRRSAPDRSAPPVKPTSEPQPEPKPSPRKVPRKQTNQPKPWQKPLRENQIIAGPSPRGKSPSPKPSSTQEMVPAHVADFLMRQQKGSGSGPSGSEEARPQLYAPGYEPDTRVPSTGEETPGLQAAGSKKGKSKQGKPAKEKSDEAETPRAKQAPKTPPELHDLNELSGKERIELANKALNRHENEGRHVLLVAVLGKNIEFLAVSGKGGASGHTEYVVMEHLLQNHLIGPGDMLLFQGIHAPCPFKKCGMCSNVMALAAVKLHLDIIYDTSALRVDLKSEREQLADLSKRNRDKAIDAELDKAKSRTRIYSAGEGQLRGEEYKDPTPLEEKGTAEFERMRALIDARVKSSKQKN